VSEMPEIRRVSQVFENKGAIHIRRHPGSAVRNPPKLAEIRVSG
jgi:hypothetical protein